ncbi:DgyrCDS11917 [Dimorphilus gyrociliatus]|uniref:DgyrCDS11917 n=1 Tax=Dimorphilus gyrociliatus TaxID=2664684 RepID=A0A7I8W6R1_9ANNE|nr:DgyrCDS11917 [Dimorphilus gyrociliatus]
MALKSPAAERNKEPILQVLKEVLKPQDEKQAVLEIAAGTGQHAVYFSQNLTHLTWLPTDCDEKYLKSIRDHIEAASGRCFNVQTPLLLDVTINPSNWASGKLTNKTFDVGLFKGSGYYLKKGGLLITYGPYKLHGIITPESNVQFDNMLRQQNAEWGLRDVDELEKLAKENGMQLEKMFDMPSNNKILLFRKD